MQKTTLISGCAGLRILAVFLSVSMVSSNTLQIHLVPPKPRVGQTVLFNATGITDRIRSSEWFRGNGTSATNQIIRYNNNDDSKDKGDKFFQEADILSNGSLVITNVTKALQDVYTVSIQGNLALYEGTISLQVDDSNPDDPTNHGLSDGAIAGIVIGVLAAVIVLIGGGVYAFKSKESG